MAVDRRSARAAKPFAQAATLESSSVVCSPHEPAFEDRPIRRILHRDFFGARFDRKLVDRLRAIVDAAEFEGERQLRARPSEFHDRDVVGERIADPPDFGRLVGFRGPLEQAAARAAVLGKNIAVRSNVTGLAYRVGRDVANLKVN